MKIHRFADELIKHRQLCGFNQMPYRSGGNSITIQLIGRDRIAKSSFGDSTETEVMELKGLELSR